MNIHTEKKTFTELFQYIIIFHVLQSVVLNWNYRKSSSSLSGLIHTWKTFISSSVTQYETIINKFIIIMYAGPSAKSLLWLRKSR